jgi:transcription-repair coupling factor (superfamily II helicase)
MYTNKNKGEFMKFKSIIDNEKLYRGEVPYFLKSKNNQNIYICSSNKNIVDYYFTLNRYIDVLKIENYNYTDQEFDYIIFQLLEKLKLDNSKILISIENLFKNYFINSESLKFSVKKKYRLKDIVEKLEKNDFKKNYLVENRGEYSLRGDILDIFSFDGKNPIRFEFFDNILDGIRIFDLETQRSMKKINEIQMYIDKNKDQNYTFLEILDKLKNEKRNIYLENEEVLDYKVEEYILNNRKDEKKIRLEYSKVKKISKSIKLKRFEDEEIENYKNYDYLKKLSKNKNITILTEEKKRYTEIFEGTSIKIKRDAHYEGFKNKDNLVLTDRELKGIRVKKNEKKIDRINFKKIDQILPNDYIIHEVYGVGIYLGVEDINGEDYLKIKYADEDKLFVPIVSLNKIERYISEPGIVPDIFRLGRRGFRKRQEKIKKEIEKFAIELLQIQAKREMNVGYSFTKDTIWQEEFEEGFPYNETKDQLKAILDVKEDMESFYVMDRIVCGDVGYGKTEVAMRAAFKAVMDGKQVVILAPTTVLATQHFERFQERFQNFPIELELLSRLKTSKEQTETIKKLREGVVDIVIGTHRLLSKDIKFKDLGLVIIDEEQKFGVKAKEHLKTMRTNVDMLTLTATPIPRTLNLALLGIRDISIIQTPPTNRLPIETFIVKKNKDIIKKAIIKEIAREGQVFYLYNSVKGMNLKLNELRKIIPEYITIDFIHGQMPSNEIKYKINSFENGEIDVLLTTTIIENGIDIENANTILIENFDKLGLSQVYQLRGRVGRSNRRAYCYLLVDSLKGGTEKGKQKRESIKEIKDLGAGFQLSLEDMKIRGAGEILGDKQHGALKIFGYDMYLKMLNEEVKKIKGKEVITEDVELEIEIHGYIPSKYIDEAEKIVIYRRLVSIEKISELEELKDEIKDRFGRLPKVVEDLFEYLSIKILAQKNNIKSIKKENNLYKIKFIEGKMNFEKLQELIISKKIKYIQKEKVIEIKNIRIFFEDYK